MAELLRKCPACKAVLDPDDRFCGFCGSGVEGPGAPMSPGFPSSRPVSPPPLPHGEGQGPVRGIHAGLPPSVPPPPRRVAPTAPPASPSESAAAGSDPFEGFRQGASEDELPGGAPGPVAAGTAVAPATGGADPGFWIRNRGFGLLLLRLALGFLLVFGWNPMAMGGVGGGEEAEIMGDLPYWVDVAVELDLPQLYFGVVATHMAAGLLIILGLLFRPACFLAAGSYAAVLAFQLAWAVEFMTVIDFVQSGAMALVFLGLMFAGPGRLAVGGAERRALKAAGGSAATR